MKTQWMALVAALMLIAGRHDAEKHFITDDAYRQQVTADFERARELAARRSKQLFGVMNHPLTTREREALMFLYAYMPLNDLADYNGEFFLRNVKLAFAAADTFAWGKTVPEDIFLHFVLPYRVNNENLDSSRAVFFRELLPRVRHLGMREAALEVNHWCHEKVNYRGTDGRTIAPLGAICTAYGRCGEESTFTTTALRAVGIPARQVYTPRWAHTDDNHAWVEVWVDGKWHFLGACEPAPDLNQGWFAGPALRTMMVHTNAYGRYNGPGKVLQSSPKFARLNLLENYAPAKTVTVKVVTSGNKPADKAYLEFGLYNYAEFYPLAATVTDSLGCASLETGYGDLMVWASAGNLFNLSRLTVETTDTLQLVLHRTKGESFVMESDLVPPVVKEPAKASEEGQLQNVQRLAAEDSVREATIARFIAGDAAHAEAGRLDLDTTRVWHVLKNSRGNWPTTLKFLSDTPPENRQLALILLETLAEKDLHDTPFNVLTDHLDAYLRQGGSRESDEIGRQYLLNPRIDLEMLTPYRSLLADSLAPLHAATASATVQNLTQWIGRQIIPDSVNNHFHIRISPVGVFEIRRSDKANRDLFFVAACRSLGVAARLEPATRAPQYFDIKWFTVQFEAASPKPFVADKGYLTLTFDPRQRPEPLYSIHFSLARFTGKRMQTLAFEEMKPLSRFPIPVGLQPGYYRLLTGNRLSDGTVLVKQQFFSLGKGEQKTVDLTLREEAAPLQTLAVWKNHPLAIVLPAIIGWIDPESEPGRHFLADIEPVKGSLEAAGVPMMIFTADETTARKIVSRLPVNARCVADAGWKLAKACAQATGLTTEASLPAFIVLGSDGKVFYHTSGYQIGTGEQLLKVMQRVRR